MLKRLQFTLVFTFTALYSFSQEPIALDSVIISASQLSMESHKTGKSVQIIEGDEILKYPVNSLDELLRFVGGMNINSRGAFGVQSDIGMRGSTFSQIIVLVDDVRINDPLTGHFNNNFPIAIADIDRVEIVRGPASVSYGSDAVGGVIHIRTKTNLNNKITEKSGAIFDKSFGQYSLETTDAGALIRLGSSDHFSVSYRRNKAKGEELSNPNFPSVESASPTYNNHFDLNTLSLSSAHKLSKDYSLQTRVSYDFREFGAKFFYTRSAFDESTEKTTNLWTQVNLQRVKEKSKVKLNLSYKNSTDFFEFNPLFAPNDHEMNQVFVNLAHSIKLGEKTDVAYGAQILNKDIESSDRGAHSNLSVAGYAILSKELSRNFHGNLSLRGENDENFGLEFLPQASLSYKLNNYLIHTSYGRSVRAADFTERYVSFNIPSLSPNRNAGNPDLVAEESNSIDIGISYMDGLSGFSVTGFYRKSTNLIDFSLVNELDISNLSNLQDSADYFYANNVSETDVYGIETSVYSTRVLSSNVSLKTEIAYTFLKTEGVDNELSKYISNHPEHNLSASLLLFGESRFLLGLNGNYITRQEESVNGSPFLISKDYFIANGTISYNAAKNFHFYSKVYNFTNTQYQEILGAKMPGSWWSLGLQVKI